MSNPIRKTNFRIKFLGNSAGKIADNMFLLDITRCKILLDCGLYEEAANDLSVYQVNKRPLQIKYNAIDYIILSGYELENCGLLPRLYQQGCRARVCVPIGTKKLISDMLYKNLDQINEQVKIMNRRVNNKKACDYLPLYTEQDVRKAVTKIIEYRYGKCYELQNGVKFTYYYSGYSVGTAQIRVELTVKNETKTIGYTGNIGSTVSGNFVMPRENLPPSDVLIGEATKTSVSQTAIKPRADIVAIKKTIEETCKQKGNRVLLICPSVNTLQILLTMIYSMYKKNLHFKIPIIVDMPFGKSVNEYYNKLVQKDSKLWERVKNWDNITWIDSPNQHRGQLGSSKAKIIITSIDSMDQERGKRWIEKFLQDKNSCVGFCGCYDSPFLSQLKDKKKFQQIKITKKMLKPLCKINWHDSFDKHADYDELIKYYTGIGTSQIFLVHANPSLKKDFIKQLKNKLSWEGQQTEVLNPEVELVYYIQ